MTRARLLLLIFAAQSFLVPSSCTENDEEREILKRSLPAYAIISNAKLLNSSRCGKELEELRVAVDDRHLWSLKVFDSSGKPTSGFLYGNNYWMGSRSQCEDSMNRKPLILMLKEIANNSRYRHVEDEFPPFDVQFFVAYFKHNSTLQYHVRLPNEDLITLGLCLPASCTSNELATILESIFNNRSLIFGDLYLADFRLEEVKDLKDDHRWLISGSFIIVMLVLAVTFLLMAAGTVHDILMRRQNNARKELSHSCENNNTSMQLSTKPSYEDPEEQQANPKPQSVLGQILQAFSIYTNTNAVFSTKLPPSSVPVIHGLRFISMIWIIMLHTLFYMTDVAENKVWSWRKAEGFAEQIMSNATLVVDTFFFLSGFLITHMYLLNEQNKKQSESSFATEAKNLFLLILKRFIRLTPAYMMSLGIYEINTKWYSKTSLFYINERGHETCHKYWWRNILYIQNFFSRNTMCMSWSWYLANDMQFFIIGIFLLRLSSTHLKAAVGLLIVLFAGSTIASGYISYIYEYVPTMDQQYHLLEVIYDPPWVRIGPYLVGMVTGYIYLKLDKNLQLKTRTVIILWILGSACNVTVLFGLAEKQISVIAAAFYIAFYRTIWGIGIAWIVIACCTNNAGIVNKILSFKAWIPLSRLTYCAYLLNPILITSVYLHSETSVHVDFLRNGSIFLGNFMISYICAYAFTLMFEAPYVQLMRQAIGKKK